MFVLHSLYIDIRKWEGGRIKCLRKWITLTSNQLTDSAEELFRYGKGCFGPLMHPEEYPL